MKTLSRTVLTLFLISMTSSLLITAQESGSCTEKLKNAETLFERGQVSRVPGLLTECLKSGFTREESVAAFKLIIQAFQLEDRLDLADSAMLEFLKLEPEYQVNPTDHSGFIHLFNTFESKKVLQAAFRTGMNMSYLTFIVPASSSVNTLGSRYTINPGLYVSGEAKFSIGRNIEFNAEIGYSRVSFHKLEQFVFGELGYTENQNRLEFPLTLSYDFRTFGRFTTYARLGAGPSINLKTGSVSVFSTSDRNNPYPRPEEEIQRNNSRITADFFIQAGGGIKFKIREGYIFSEIRSNFAMRNQNISSPLTDELYWHYFYADDDFHLNTLNLNIGYIRILYKPIKKEE